MFRKRLGVTGLDLSPHRPSWKQNVIPVETSTKPTVHVTLWLFDLFDPGRHQFPKLLQPD